MMFKTAHEFWFWIEKSDLMPTSLHIVLETNRHLAILKVARMIALLQDKLNV